MTEVELENAKKSIVTLANASELVAQIVTSVAGNDISNSLKGNRITLNMIRNIAQARFQNKLNLHNERG